MADVQLAANEVITQTTILEAIERLAKQHIALFIPGVKSFPLEAQKDISSDHWVASVLLNASKAQIHFRVHFSTALSRNLLADHFKTDPTQINPLTAHDHLREFCNLIMGRVKGALAPELSMDEKTKVFLPKVDPSYDNYKKVPAGTEKAIEERWWRMVWDGGELMMYAKVKSAGGFSNNVLAALAQDNVIVVDNEGDIDFL